MDRCESCGNRIASGLECCDACVARAQEAEQEARRNTAFDRELTLEEVTPAHRSTFDIGALEGELDAWLEDLASSSDADSAIPDDN